MQSKKSFETKIQERNHYLSISKIKNPTNRWTIHGYISLYCHSSSPFLRHRIPLCRLPSNKFRVCCVIGVGLSMDLDCSPRSSKALGTESRSPGGEQLAIRGGSTSSQAWGGVSRWSYPVPGRIHFGIGSSLSDDGIKLRQSFGRSPLVYSRAIALGFSMY